MGKRSVVLGSVVQTIKMRKVPDTNEMYAASEDGHIYCYSRARVNAQKPHPFRLSETIGMAGYPFVSVVIAGTRKTKAVHTLVTRAFHGRKPSPIHECRHLDGDRTNNVSCNLAWGTPAENEADKKRHGRTAQGETHGQAKLTDEAVRIIRASIPAGLWNTSDAAVVFGVEPSTIRRIASGRYWKHIK